VGIAIYHSKAIFKDFYRPLFILFFIKKSTLQFTKENPALLSALQFQIVWTILDAAVFCY